MIDIVYPLIKAKLLGKKIPYIVELYITNKCNMNCKYCYVKKTSKELTTEEWIARIDQLYSLGTRVFSILGGEPLLKKGIDRIINHILEKKCICNLITNGTNIHKHIDTIKDIGRVFVSYPNEIDRKPGTKNRILDNIEMALSKGIKVSLIFTVTKNNIKEYRPALEYARKIGAKILPAECVGGYEDALSMEETFRFWEQTKEYKKEYPIIKPTHIINRMLKTSIRHDEYIYNRCVGYPKCQFGRYMCIVLPDGTYDSCCMKYGKYKAVTWEDLINKRHCDICRNLLQNTTNETIGLDYETIKIILKEWTDERKSQEDKKRAKEK